MRRLAIPLALALTAVVLAIGAAAAVGVFDPAGVARTVSVAHKATGHSVIVLSPAALLGLQFSLLVGLCAARWCRWRRARVNGGLPMAWAIWLLAAAVLDVAFFLPSAWTAVFHSQHVVTRHAPSLDEALTTGGARHGKGD